MAFNTGLNTISSNITDAWGSVQGVGFIVKNGAGTWVLSGSNLQSGTNTNVGGSTGSFVNAGTLVLENNNAAWAPMPRPISCRSPSPALWNWRVIRRPALPSTLDNGLSLNLNDGGTVRSNGSQTTNARINVNAAAFNVTISTKNAGDVFTVGNAANDVTGGSANSVIHVAGPGKILLTNASNYAGSTWSLDSRNSRHRQRDRPGLWPHRPARHLWRPPAPPPFSLTATA